jgi:hypothetical protein
MDMNIEFMFLLECVLLQQQLQILSRTVTVKPKGRPLKYITEKERKDAIKNGRKNARKDARNNKRENICQ